MSIEITNKKMDAEECFAHFSQTNTPFVSKSKIVEQYYLTLQTSKGDEQYLVHLPILYLANGRIQYTNSTPHKKPLEKLVANVLKHGKCPEDFSNHKGMTFRKVEKIN